MAGAIRAVVVEDDPFLRMVEILLDPNTPAGRSAAFADFFAHDEPDFDGYCSKVRQNVGTLFPTEVRIVTTPDAMNAALPGARALIVQSFIVGKEELAAAPDLGVVQKFGVDLRNIDQAACAANGIKVLTLRRRANCACAEMAFSLMLALAKKLNQVMSRITAEQLAEAGYSYRPFDRRHTPNSNWARIPGVRMLYGSTLGIVGLGEIGREVALRAVGFGMRTLYYQRHRLPAVEEDELNVSYVPLAELLSRSDWILPLLPTSPSTRGLIGRNEIERVKPGAVLVNVGRADTVDRAGVLDALRSGRLGGFALDPLYEAPGRKDDELLCLPNVVLTPHLAGSPRFNALDDMAELCAGIAKVLAT